MCFVVIIVVVALLLYISGVYSKIRHVFIAGPVNIYVRYLVADVRQ